MERRMAKEIGIEMEELAYPVRLSARLQVGILFPEWFPIWLNRKTCY
jgi:hypothetical protein